MSFPARYDRTAIVVTSIVTAVLLLVAAVSQSLWFGGLSVLIIAIAYAFSPRVYEINGRDIVVRRLIRDVRITNIEGARRATSEDFEGALRLWGNGGIFGYYGLFRTSKLGKTWWYVTNRANSVLISTAEGLYLVSPDDPARFLASLGAPAASSTQAQVSTASTLSAGVVIGVLAAAFTVAVFLYAPGPPDYTLTSGALAIHDRFYPITVGAHDVDLTGIRIVDVTKDKDWRPTRRTNGFANSHYRSGWFRTANGRRVLMYRAEGARVILLPPNGNTEPVLIEVASPETFIEELRRTWTTHPKPRA